MIISAIRSTRRRAATGATRATGAGLPVVATRTGGPLSFVNTVAGRPNGWFVDPDDEAALAAALIDVVNDAPERRARGEAAYEQIRGGYA